MLLVTVEATPARRRGLLGYRWVGTCDGWQGCSCTLLYPPRPTQLRSDEQAVVLSAIVDVALAATARTPLLTIAALASELRALFDASSPGGASLLQAGLRPKVLVGVAQLVEDVVSDDATLASRKHEALETLGAGLGDASAVARALLPVAVPESQVRPPSARIPPRVLLLRLNLLSYSCSSSTRLSERLAIAQSLQTAEFSLSQPRHPVSRVFPKLTGPMLFHPLLRQRQMHP